MDLELLVWLVWLSLLSVQELTRLVQVDGRSFDAKTIASHLLHLEHLDLAAVHLHRNRNNQLALGAAQNVPQRLFQLEIVSRTIELLLGNLKRIEFFLRRCSCHDSFS